MRREARICFWPVGYSGHCCLTGADRDRDRDPRHHTLRSTNPPQCKYRGAQGQKHLGHEERGMRHRGEHPAFLPGSPCGLRGLTPSLRSVLAQIARLTWSSTLCWAVGSATPAREEEHGNETTRAVFAHTVMTQRIEAVKQCQHERIFIYAMPLTNLQACDWISSIHQTSPHPEPYAIHQRREIECLLAR